MIEQKVKLSTVFELRFVITKIKDVEENIMV